jgi:hypothetical protein
VLAGATPTGSCINDLQVPEDADVRVRAALAGQRLRAFHATRLFDHERGMIAERGLQVFGSDLFDDRIHEALAHGVISEAEHDTLLATHMYGCPSMPRPGHDHYPEGDRPEWALQCRA